MVTADYVDSSNLLTVLARYQGSETKLETNQSDPQPVDSVGHDLSIFLLSIIGCFGITGKRYTISTKIFAVLFPFVIRRSYDLD